MTSRFADINKLAMAQGRFISDLDRYSFFVVLGAGAAKKLAGMGEKNPLGKTIYFKNRGFKIVGVLKRAAEGGMRPFEINPGMMIPIHTSFLFKRYESVSEIMARLSPAADLQQVKSSLQRFF